MLPLMKMVMKIILTGLCLALILHALSALRTGRVYSKGLWLSRSTNRLGYWVTVLLYLLGLPWIVVLAWMAS